MKDRTHASAEPLSSICIEPEDPVLPVLGFPRLFPAHFFQAVERVVGPNHLALADLAMHELINTH